MCIAQHARIEVRYPSRDVYLWKIQQALLTYLVWLHPDLTRAYRAFMWRHAMRWLTAQVDTAGGEYGQ